MSLPHLTAGFLPLLDSALLVLAHELGIAEEEGFTLGLTRESSWANIRDRTALGHFDIALVLAPMPIAANLGLTPIATPMIAPVMTGLGNNAITVSADLWTQMADAGAPGDLAAGPAGKALAQVIHSTPRKLRLAVVHQTSSHNYELRYWLAAGGINPGYYSPEDVSGQIAADAYLSVTPPPQMPSTLEAGTIDGYAVGEPWNQAAVFKKIGVPVITDYEIWKNNPEKVFGITAEFAENNPNSTLAVTKALIRAAKWLDENDNANRAEAVEILSRSEYVGADAEVIAASMTGTFEFEAGDVRDVPDFNVFYRYFATYPYYSDAVWYLTQMRRWGQVAEDMPDSWYDEVAKSVYKPEIYLEAARLLVEEGLVEETDFPWDSTGYREPTAEFIDGVTYDGTQPNAYIDSLPIGLKTGDSVVGADVIAAAN